MLKLRGLLLCFVISFVAIVGVIAYGVYRDSNNYEVFNNSGYILLSPDSTYSDDINTQIYFEEGTKYKKVYPNKIVFEDQKKNKIVVDNNSFVHYNDGSISSLTQGVMMDLNNLNDAITNYYGLSTESIMENNGNEFMLDNSGNSMSFDDFVWKIDGNKYLLVSGNINMKFSDSNERTFQDYVELAYYDTGIIRIVSKEGTWQTVSANCIATLDNGVSLNLSNKTVVADSIVKLSLEQMVIGSDDNINIVPVEKKQEVQAEVQAEIQAEKQAEAVKIPKFDIQTIDGTDGMVGLNGEDGEIGEDGKEGTEGEQGEAGKDGESGDDGDDGDDGLIGANGTVGDPGEPGATGTTGVNGLNGLNGTAGVNGAAGANGAKGESGKSGDELSGNIGNGGSEDTDGILLPKFDVKELEVKTNSVTAAILVVDEENRLDTTKEFTVQIVENSTGKQVYMEKVDSSNRDFTITYNGLKPDSEYRLVLSADYIVDNVSFSRFFVNKLFVTDALGIRVEKSYATSNSLAIKVSAKDYTNIVSADLQLTDSVGNAIRTTEIHMVLAAEDTGEIIVFENLDSNTLYKVKVVNIELNYDTNLVSPSQMKDEEYWTLKKSPALGAPVVVVNKRNASFEFKLDSVEDLDGAITKFRYEIYEVAYDGTERLAKRLYNTTNDMIPCYVDDVEIKHGYNYRMRIVAECYDNEKVIEYSSTYSEVFNLTGDNFPIVLFLKDEVQTHHDKITGTLCINTNGAILTVNEQNPLIIEYKNSKGDIDTYQLTELPDYHLLDEKQIQYTIPFTEGNLLAKDNYIISAYGTVDLNDGVGARKRSLVGSVVVKTDTPEGFTANFSQDTNLTSPVSFRINLADAIPSVSSLYEASTIEYIEINLYNGDETAVNNTAPVATYTLEGTEGENYNSTLMSKVYGNNTLLLTEKDFNISAAAITSSKYTVEVSAVRDYTRYGNEFTVANNVRTFTKQATLPDLNTIDKNNGLIVTPITLANISQYVAGSELYKYENYDADVVFGYEISAAYFDNSAGLVQSFIYYAYEEANYQTAATAASFYMNNTPLAMMEVSVPVTNTVPRAVFLFGQNEASSMSRGSRYVFTYRAKLKQGDDQGITEYFPECVDPAVVIRSKTARAPYQTPVFFFYPWVSDANSVTWKYYIKSPDTEAIASNFSTSRGTLTGAAPILNKFDDINSKVEVTINGLTRSNTYNLTVRTKQFKNIYNSSVEVSLVGQYFESLYALTTNTTSLTYELEDLPLQNRYRLTLNDTSTAEHLSRVVAAKVQVYKSKTGSPVKTLTIPLDNVTGQVGVGFLRYGDIKEFLGSTLYYTVTAVYDTGISGFMGAQNSYRAIQLLPANAKGNYITLNYTYSGLSEDVSGNAKGSYFYISGMNNQTSVVTFNFQSALESTYSSSLSMICNQSGARLQNLNGLPNATLKKLDEVILPIAGSAIKETFSEFTFNTMTPTINLNRGAAYTIDTTVTSATVHWKLEGQDEKLKLNEIKNSTMYMDLYTINNLGIKTYTGVTIPTVIAEKVYSYDTLISDLMSNTKYGIQIYYYDTATSNKIYPINAYRPDVEPSTNVYTFTTNENIVIAQSSLSLRYVANSYLDKYLQIGYSLNQTLGFDIDYSIIKKEGTVYTELLSTDDLASRGIIHSPMVKTEIMTDERLMLQPGKLYWTENGQTVYFPFNSTAYYLCIKPVSETNASILLGEPVYLQLNVPTLNTPFYNIKTIPNENAVKFQISIVDLGKVMVYGHYKIKILNGAGDDITPEGYKNVTYSSASPVSINVNNIADDDRAVLKIYTVYDLKNDGLASNGTALPDIKDIAYESLDAPVNYLKVSYTGYPLGESGYDLGEMQIAQSSSERARIYFTNPVNLGIVKYVRYVIVNEAGVSYSYNDLFTPVVANSTSSYYELSHKFQTLGVYQIQIRFYDETMTQLKDVALTYFKNY
ncbi:MAG: hypothetical protein QM644_15300 [Mobilitalea sp.]